LLHKSYWFITSSFHTTDQTSLIERSDMAGVTLGVFTNREAAEAAIEDLHDTGYNPKDISIVTRDTTISRDIAQDTGASVAEGAASGATTGGILGGLAGLLIGIGIITVPGIGGLLIGGPIAAALGLTGAAASTVQGVVTGALAGGLIGALVGLGVPEEDARVYESRVKAGGILLAVPSSDSAAREARLILDDHGAEQTKFIETDESGARRWRMTL
jgi:hypothetical protein